MIKMTCIGNPMKWARLQLPPEQGCEICRMGAGIVLFVTGNASAVLLYTVPSQRTDEAKTSFLRDEQPVEQRRRHPAPKGEP